MSFQSYNHRIYCLLYLATQKKFESEISYASFKFKKTHLVKQDFKPFALSFKKMILLRNLMFLNFRKNRNSKMS